MHFEDIWMLLKVLQRLVDRNNTVIVIEHNLDVIKTVDWIIDLGPEGGDGGGNIVAIGTPEEVASIKNSYTGLFLKEILKNNRIGLNERIEAKNITQNSINSAWGLGLLI